MEAGPCTSDSMSGGRALSWLEVQAYTTLTGALSEPWEARWLHAASEAYLTELELGKKPLTIAPMDRGKPLEWDDDDD